MARCEICLKSGMYGNNVSHSKKRTRTRSLANIQKSKINDKGVLRQVNIWKFYYTTNIYNKSLISKTPQQFFFHPNPFLLNLITILNLVKSCFD